MLYLLNFILLSGMAFGAPGVPSVERSQAVFEVERFYAGGLPSTSRNFAMFSIQPTPGASFANCSVNTDTGAVVPTVNKLVCSDINSITWSLEPMGPGMHFSVWWAFTSRASLFGEKHFSPSDFNNIDYPDGSVVQTYVGQRNFTLETKTVMSQPGKRHDVE